MSLQASSHAVTEYSRHTGFALRLLLLHLRENFQKERFKHCTPRTALCCDVIDQSENVFSMPD